MSYQLLCALFTNVKPPLRAYVIRIDLNNIVGGGDAPFAVPQTDVEPYRARGWHRSYQIRRAGARSQRKLSRYLLNLSLHAVVSGPTLGLFTVR